MVYGLFEGPDNFDFKKPYLEFESMEKAAVGEEPPAENYIILTPQQHKWLKARYKWISETFSKATNDEEAIIQLLLTKYGFCKLKYSEWNMTTTEDELERERRKNRA